jgi:hypothetical protein
MEVSRRISLFGDSIILGMLGNSLQRCSHFEVTTITLSLPLAAELEALKLCDPFDSGGRSFPRTLLFAGKLPRADADRVSPDKNITKVWSGRQVQNYLSRIIADVEPADQ